MGLGNFLLKLADARCPNCNYHLKIEGLEKAQARGELQCPHCQFTIKANSPSVPFKLDKSNAVATPQVKVSPQGSEFQVDVKWLSKSSGFIISFALMWNGIVGLIGYFLIFAKTGRVSNQTLGYAIIGLFGLIGLRLVYLALCEFFNTTTILIKTNKIEFWTKPFSMKAGQVIDVADIANLSLERSEAGKQNDRRVFNHFVNIQLKNGNLVRLCKVQDMNEGMYVEKLLEDKLRLTDIPNLDRVAF